ncbi:glycoside hydrolase family 2 TIM barrel-domain containing protein [Bifidobacterium miconisargentati]|uniref:glycoside hydrolase family 2 TIM barrel-domain containing protein n=1 Tax=Bifidobacterium miconisargentati TaxID=2834437 RepID=UPI001BDD7DC8|nr:glycoside hydrolase family 2 TIM barrel-domain containing protein [Bifidobacterium miconisargentati]MBW3091282.1 DUF4982 domain-containing protein [Bifidobacterium miconisargentati]
MKRIDVNHHWQFRSIDGGSWQSVTLPHDAMIRETRDPNTPNGYNTGYYPGGIYEYRTTLHVAATPAAALLEFEGVYPGATVLVNDEPAGELTYGYGDYYLDIAALLNPGANALTVLVDNSRCPNSRWYSGSGIYRPVWMWVADTGDTADSRIPSELSGLPSLSGQSIVRGPSADVTKPAPSDSPEPSDAIRPDAVRIDTVAIADDDSATITINLDQPIGLNRYLWTTVADASGTTVARFRGTTGTIPHVRPWSPAAPALYTARIELCTAVGTVLDIHTERFGIRTLTCDAEHGLRLNGGRLLLNGGCVHHDNGILGAATLPQAEYRRARIMKEQGFNAVRSAHNPLSKAFLDACDEVGLLVMDEAFDMWWMHKTSYDYAGSFRDHYVADLAAMVRKDRNHPSVVLYSIGNEIADTKSPRAAEAARSMRSIIRGLDPSRPVIDCVNPISLALAAKTKAGMDEHDAKVEGEPGLNTTLEHSSGPALLTAIDRLMPLALATGIMDRQTDAVFREVDVAGLNYCRQGPEWFHRRHPQRVFCASETYPQEIAYTWPAIRRLPYLIGDFVWTGWDYIGEASVSAWAYAKPEPDGWTAEYGNRAALRGHLTGPYRRYPGLLGGSGLIDITGEPTGQMLYRQVVTGVRRRPAITVRPMQLLYGGEAVRPGRTSRFIERGHDGVTSWSWAGYEGRDALIQVYSGGRCVRLLLNGRPVGGAVPVRRCMTEFRVPYEPGELTAVTYAADGRELGRDTLVSAGPEIVVSTRCERVPNPYPQDDPRWDDTELVFQSIALTDAHGVVHATSDRRITMTLEPAQGDAPDTPAFATHGAELLGVASGNPITKDELAGPTCTTYFGRAMAVWRVPAGVPLHTHVTVES